MNSFQTKCMTRILWSNVFSCAPKMISPNSVFWFPSWSKWCYFLKPWTQPLSDTIGAFVRVTSGVRRRGQVKSVPHRLFLFHYVWKNQAGLKRSCLSVYELQAREKRKRVREQTYYLSKPIWGLCFHIPVYFIIYRQQSSGFHLPPAHLWHRVYENSL